MTSPINSSRDTGDGDRGKSPTWFGPDQFSSATSEWFKPVPRSTAPNRRSHDGRSQTRSQPSEMDARSHQPLSHQWRDQGAHVQGDPAGLLGNGRPFAAADDDRP